MGSGARIKRASWSKDRILFVGGTGRRYVYPSLPGHKGSRERYDAFVADAMAKERAAVAADGTYGVRPNGPLPSKGRATVRDVAPAVRPAPAPEPRQARYRAREAEIERAIQSGHPEAKALRVELANLYGAMGRDPSEGAKAPSPLPWNRPAAVDPSLERARGIAASREEELRRKEAHILAAQTAGGHPRAAQLPRELADVRAEIGRTRARRAQLDKEASHQVGGLFPGRVSPPPAPPVPAIDWSGGILGRGAPQGPGLPKYPEEWAERKRQWIRARDVEVKRRQRTPGTYEHTVARGRALGKMDRRDEASAGRGRALGAGAEARRGRPRADQPGATSRRRSEESARRDRIRKGRSQPRIRKRRSHFALLAAAAGIHRGSWRGWPSPLGLHRFAAY